MDVYIQIPRSYWYDEKIDVADPHLIKFENLGENNLNPISAAIEHLKKLASDERTLQSAKL